MQKKLSQRLIAPLSLTGLALLIMLPLSLLFSFRTAKAIDGLWEQLGLSKESGTRNIKESFINGYLYHYGAGKAKQIASGNRAALAKDLLQYSKDFLNSPQFLQEYQKIRSQAKPVPDEKRVRTKEEIRQERIAETEKSIRETEKNLKAMSAEMAKSMAPVIDVLKDQLKEYKDPNSEMIELMYQGELMNKQAAERSFQERMQQWEQAFPVDPKQLIKTRLQHFIELAATVNFNAALKTVGDKKKFVNAEYEGKSDEWKKVYRAGREVIEPSVAFAKQWLAELGQTK